MGADGRDAEFIVRAILDELRTFPVPVMRHIGFNIRLLQQGEMPAEAKQMRGFDPPVIEWAEHEQGDTYRCCVTVMLEHRVYVLHAFKKKSK